MRRTFHILVFFFCTERHHEKVLRIPYDKLLHVSDDYSSRFVIGQNTLRTGFVGRSLGDRVNHCSRLPEPVTVFWNMLWLKIAGIHFGFSYEFMRKYLWSCENFSWLLFSFAVASLFTKKLNIDGLYNKKQAKRLNIIPTKSSFYFEV